MNTKSLFSKSQLYIDKTTWIKKKELLSLANAKCYTVQKKNVAPKGN